MYAKLKLAQINKLKFVIICTQSGTSSNMVIYALNI